jgi:hypothetical protein
LRGRREYYEGEKEKKNIKGTVALQVSFIILSYVLRKTEVLMKRIKNAAKKEKKIADILKFFCLDWMEWE